VGNSYGDSQIGCSSGVNLMYQGTGGAKSISNEGKFSENIDYKVFITENSP